jgi:hypothetical protein
MSAVTTQILPGQEDVLFNSKIVNVFLDGLKIKTLTLDDAFAQKNAALIAVITSCENRDLTQSIFDQVSTDLTPETE